MHLKTSFSGLIMQLVAGIAKVLYKLPVFLNFKMFFPTEKNKYKKL